MKNKRIAIIGTVGLPAKYGGFETLANHLVSNLCDKYDFTVYCSKKKYKKEERLLSYKGAKLHYIPLEANGIQSILYDSISILHSLWSNDVLLILGVAGAWLLPFVRFFTNKKIIISIDGIEWKRDKWSLAAKLYLWWSEMVAVRFSHIDISDNESIQDYTAIRYKTLSRVIEYGADHTIKVSPGGDDLERYPFLKTKYAVKVCRIEPENNVHLVLEAFKIQAQMNLVLVGNWKNSDYGQKLKQAYKDVENIHLLDPIYQQREIDLIRANASLYIHGHSAGGTNPSLVEAMYLKLPVVAFKVSYNITTTEGKAVYFSSIEDLVEELNTQSQSELLDMANEMSIIAEGRYTWGAISRLYDLLIKEALSSTGKVRVSSELQNLDACFLQNFELLHLQHSNFFYQN
jgi:glycosyltransferase involved in cell wall biosynthesis